MLENVTAIELMKYENNYKALNAITTAFGRNVYERISHLDSAHAVWENYVIPLRVRLRLSQPVRTLTIGSTKLSLRNLVSLLMIALLGLSPS
jgi:hypothetical protein